MNSSPDRGSWIGRMAPGFIKRAVIKSLMSSYYGTGWQVGLGGPSWMADKSEAFIRQGFMMNPIVYSIVSFVTRLASQIPWVLYQVKEDKFLRRYKSVDPEDLIREGIWRVKGLDEISSHRILEIWKQPNQLQGQYEFVEQMLGYKMVTGNTYVYGVGPETGPNQGQFHELSTLPAQHWRIQPGNAQNPIQYYYPAYDQSVHVPPDQIMHSKFWNPLSIQEGGLYGLSPIQASSRTVTRSNDSLTASVKSLQNMGAVGMMSVFAEMTGIKQLTPEQADEIKRKYYEEHGGPENRGKIIVTSAPLKWQQMGMSPVDLNIIEQEKMDLRVLCNIFGLQSQLFNDPENKAYNNMREAIKGAYTQVTIPLMRSIRDELNRWWIDAFEDDRTKLWFDMDLQAIPELQSNMKELAEWLMDTWWLKPNERRVVMDYDELDLPGMNDILVPDGFSPIDTIRLDMDAVDKYLKHQGIEL